MQISAANLLATQQMKPAQQAGAPAKTDAFEALLFRQAGKPAAAAASSANAVPAGPLTAPRPPGSQIDIRI
jgi:hypothetical protein